MSDLQQAYKEVMSHWPSGVAVVTSVLDSKRYGMTVSSFTSVSLHPPMVSICIDKRAQMCAVLQKTRKFAVNILDNTPVELAQIFSNHDLDMSERFEKANFENCLGFLDCDVHSFHDTGDHVIYVGQILEAHTLEQRDPLIYYKRGWYGNLTRL